MDRGEVLFATLSSYRFLLRLTFSKIYENLFSFIKTLRSWNFSSEGSYDIKNELFSTMEFMHSSVPSPLMD
jgi:hypothetical protein